MRMLKTKKHDIVSCLLKSLALLAELNFEEK